MPDYTQRITEEIRSFSSPFAERRVHETDTDGEVVAELTKVQFSDMAALLESNSSPRTMFWDKKVQSRRYLRT